MASSQRILHRIGYIIIRTVDGISLNSTRWSTYAPAYIDSQTNGQYVGDEQWRQEDFQKLSWENTTFFHDASIPHTKSPSAFRVFELEFLWRDIFWSAWPIPYPVSIFLHYIFYLAFSFQVIFLRLWTVFLPNTVRIHLWPTAILMWSQGTWRAVTVGTPSGAGTTRFMLSI